MSRKSPGIPLVVLISFRWRYELIFVTGLNAVRAIRFALALRGLRLSVERIRAAAVAANEDSTNLWDWVKRGLLALVCVLSWTLEDA